MPGHTLVPQGDQAPDSPTLHGITGVDESNQDTMITGYDCPTKPTTKACTFGHPTTTSCKGDDVQRVSVHPVPENCTTETIFSYVK